MYLINQNMVKSNQKVIIYNGKYNIAVIIYLTPTKNKEFEFSS